MASPVPAKSQPLHNFSLPHLKWKNHRTGRSRLAGETSSSSSPPHRSPSNPSYVPRRPSPLHRQSQSESESEPPVEKPNSKKIIITEKTKRSNNNNKICIRFRKNDVVPEVNQNDAVPSLATEEDDELLPKTWNLRPRRPPPMNHKQSNNSNNKIGSLQLSENRIIYKNNYKEGSELRNNDQSNVVMSKKVKFSIALSRDEIEEDIFSLTGSKPSRRPKKRPRTVQRQLDTLFPGLWLGSITADTYKVSEAPPKG